MENTEKELFKDLCPEGTTFGTFKGSWKPLFDEDALVNDGEVVFILPFSSERWIPKTVRGNATSAYPAIKFLSLGAFEEAKKNKHLESLAAIKAAGLKTNFEFYPNSLFNRATLGHIEGELFVKDSTKPTNRYTGSLIDFALPLRKNASSADAFMEKLVGDKGLAYIKESTEPLKDSWRQGWTTNKQGDQVPSNSRDDAKQGWNISTLNKLEV